MSDLPPEYLDSNTPPDVIVTDTAPPWITDPTLGVPLGEPPDGTVPAPDQPAHLLVTIGDSLTHGVSSGAVFHTTLSWPAKVAAATGVADFATPTYGGPLDGLPINLEALLRRAECSFGEDINLFEKLRAPLVLHHIVDSNEDYWERGDGSQPPPIDVRYHNLGIYGWDVRDALSFSAARRGPPAPDAAQHDNVFGAKPDRDNDIAAHSVLAPFGIDATQVGAAAATAPTAASARSSSPSVPTTRSMRSSARTSSGPWPGSTTSTPRPSSTSGRRPTSPRSTACWSGR